MSRVVFGDHAVAERIAEALASADEVERYTHGFHTWPAGLHPDAARSLISLFGGNSVGDPFMGGGTVLVEALAAGRFAFGRDLSTIAVRVSKARTSRADEATLSKVRGAARRWAAEGRAATELPPEHILKALEAWYEPHVLRELEHIRKGIATTSGEERALLEAVFSSILIKASFRRSDTSAQREPQHRPPGTTGVLFHKKARELGRRIAEFREAVPAGTPPADVGWGDARAFAPPRPLDLIVTSPPYPSTYDYLPLQHLRRVWFAEREADELEIGPRRLWREGAHGAMTRWKEDTRKWTAAAAASLCPGGHLVVVIGDGLAPAGPIDTSDPTESAAKAAGLVPVARASLERPDQARDSTRWEHVFAFRKPVA